MSTRSSVKGRYIIEIGLLQEKRWGKLPSDEEIKRMMRMTIKQLEEVLHAERTIGQTVEKVEVPASVPIVTEKLDGAVDRVEIPAKKKIMCPRWGICKARKHCEISKIYNVVGGAPFTPIIPEGCFCARFPKPEAQ